MLLTPSVILSKKDELMKLYKITSASVKSNNVNKRYSSPYGYSNNLMHAQKNSRDNVSIIK
jgi:hypothetical protein